MTANEADAGWVATVSVTHRLTDAEKECLEAINRLGSFAVSSGNPDYPNEIDDLAEREFLSRERRGETYSRGRSRNDGIDVYTLTELGTAWLRDCRRVATDTGEQP